MMEFMPCALAPAYGVTSICRFIQAATALSLDPTVAARCLCCHWGCSCILFVWILFFCFCHPLDHLASAFPHVQPSSLSGPSPCILTAGAYSRHLLLHPLPLVVPRYAPLVVFAEGEGFEPSKPVTACRVSSAVPSTTRSSFQCALRFCRKIT